MTKDMVRNHEIVVMDATSKELNDWVAEMLDLYLPNSEYYIAYPLGLDNLDKLVLKFKATDKELRNLRETLEDHHPGLFVYDPPMYV